LTGDEPAPRVSSESQRAKKRRGLIERSFRPVSLPARIWNQYNSVSLVAACCYPFRLATRQCLKHLQTQTVRHPLRAICEVGVSARHAFVAVKTEVQQAAFGAALVAAIVDRSAHGRRRQFGEFGEIKKRWCAPSAASPPASATVGSQQAVVRLTWVVHPCLIVRSCRKPQNALACTNYGRCGPDATLDWKRRADAVSRRSSARSRDG
jgi:hypothetical protein